LFEEALGKGRRGYCVTREYPLKIRTKFNLGDTPVVWLSNIGKENCIRPKDLEKLSFSLEQFLAAKDVIILLDGLEYLITNNNFLTVLRFIQSLRDQVAINHSILMMAVNPSTLDPHELNLLEKEVDGCF
jgi:archaellum biogenesis ATPase FlaH